MASAVLSPEAPPTGPASEGSQGLDLRRYWQILLRRKWLILGVAAIVMAGTAMFTYRQVRIYRATVTVIVEMAAPQVLGGNVREVVDMGSGSYWMSRDYLASQVSIINSREVAGRVVDQLKLQEVPDFWKPGPFVPGHTRDEAMGRVMGSVQVAAPKESRIMDIHVEHADPAMAARLCNAIADAYMGFNLDYKLGSTKDAVRWLADQLDDLKKELNQAELALHEFKKHNNVLAVPMEDRQNLLTRQIEKLSEHLTATSMRRMELLAKRRQILAARNADPLKDSAILLSESPVIGDIKRICVEENRKLIELKQRYLENHPLVRAQQAKLDTALTDLRREIDNALAANEARFNEVIDAQKQLAAAVEGAKKEALDLNLKEIDYNRLRRGRENTEKLYGVVLSRLKESDLSGNLRVSNMRVLDRALTPGGPVRPNVRKNLFLALALGLLAGLGLALAVEALDTTVKRQEEVEALTGLPFLGVLPSITDDPAMATGRGGNGVVDPNKDLYIHQNPKSSVAECARAIRTNVLFMSPERPLQTLLVTSTGPREGKTTTAISLAIAMAQGGQRVLLVDTDLRRPRIYRAFGVSGEVGLTNLLVGEGKLADAVKTTEVPNLFVLPCGALPPNPAELLNTDRFGAILEEMRQRYDRIICDSPPVIAVTDAAVLGARVDGVLMVVKAGHTSREGLRRSVRVLADVGCRMLGSVLNDLDVTNRDYGTYYYYYYRRYGYGYGYQAGPETAGETRTGA
jgi:capsular exopolysaccharide synthesis family protein